MTTGRTNADVLAHDADDLEYQMDGERFTLAEFLSRQIVKYRLDHGLSQRQLGELLGMGQANVARLEAGDHKPSFATLDRISRVLGLEFRIAFTRHGPHARVA